MNYLVLQDEILEDGVINKAFAVMDKNIADILAATMFLFVLTCFMVALIVLYYLVVRHRRQPNDASTTAQVVSETVVSVNEAYAKRSREQVEQFTATLDGWAEAFNTIDASWKQYIQLQQESIRIFTEHNQDSQKRQQAIITLTEKTEQFTATITEVGTKVSDMSTGFEDLKQQMAEALQILQRLDEKMDEPLELSPNALDVMRQVIDAARGLEAAMPTITKKTSQIETDTSNKKEKDE
jgi:methyl-accepting chemotaxis protein